MGYYTRYDLKIDGTREEIDRVSEYLYRTEISGYKLLKLSSYEPSKWYNHMEDMLDLSKEFPNVLFTLSGDGEDSGDFWKKYFKGGKVQIAFGEITYADFDESLLEEM